MLNMAFIKETILLASKRKKNRRSVRRVLANIDEYAEKLLVMLDTDTFVPTKPKIKQVYDQSSRQRRRKSREANRAYGTAPHEEQ
jgi:hypothetical protein|nr:MAG TPA: hypothetical protein [Caudoviricetes sp.]